MMNGPPNSIQMAQWCAGDAPGRLGGDEAARLRELMVDFLGVMTGGAREEASASVARDYAIRAGRGGRGAELRAFVMASVGHGLELDDVHNPSSLHPAVAVIPAALAVAEEERAEGRALFEAVAAGYEVVLRVGEAAGPSALYGRLFHPTAVCGVFGATAAAGRLMGLSVGQLARAFGIAWGFASGNMSFQSEGSWLKRLQVGHAAQAGIQAARLAALGALGPLHVFEPHGFFQNYAGKGDVGRLLPCAGEPLKLMEVSLKPHACCRYNQAPVDLALGLRAEGIDAGAIESIRIQIASTGIPLVGAPIEFKRAPRDPVEAQFSLPYSVAVALVAGAAGHREYRDPWLGDSRVRDLCRRISVASSPDIDAWFPAKWPARLGLRMRDGRWIERFTTDCLGDPATPLGISGVRGKFLSLVEPSLGVSEAQSCAAELLEPAGNAEFPSSAALFALAAKTI